MTGTPVANRPYDLWSQIRFLDGGQALGTEFAAFKRDLDLTNDELAYGIDADGSGNAYVTGYTDSSSLFWIGGSAIQSISRRT